MASANHILDVYQQLADCYEQRGQAQMRDRFLVLAADAAQSSGRADMAERLRLRLLQQNPHHLLKPYASLAEAMKTPDVQSYVADLRRSYSPEAAQHLLESLRSAPAGSPAPEVPARAPAPRQPEPVKESPEVLKFYRVQDNATEEAPPSMPARPVPATRPLQRPAAPLPPGPAPLPRPQAASPAAPKAPAKKPVRTPAVAPFTEPLPPTAFRPAFADREEPELTPGYWVPSLLVLLLTLAGLALAGYTLARPFLPAEWLP